MKRKTRIGQIYVLKRKYPVKWVIVVTLFNAILLHSYTSVHVVLLLIACFKERFRNDNNKCHLVANENIEQ